MTKKTKFILTTLWIILSRSYDAYCTNQLTPDLSQEANPLVSVLGMTWTPLLIVLSLLTVYSIYAYYTRVFKPMNLVPPEKGYTFNHFVAYLFLGKKEYWTAILYKFPKDIKRFNTYMGHTLIPCLSFAGIVSTLMWLLINYTNFYGPFHNVIAIYSILIGGSILIMFTWNKKMYKQYLEEIAS